MKKMIPLIALATLLLGSASASATCFQCYFANNTCHATLGDFAQACDFSSGDCVEVGVCIGAAPTIPPLATQWTIASVERLDRPRTADHAGQNTKVARVAPKTSSVR